MAERDPLDLAMEGEKADQEERRERHRRAGVQPTVEEVKMEPMPADLRAHAAGNNTDDVVKFNLESGVTSRLQARQFLELLVKTRPMVLDIGRRDDSAEVRLQQSIEVTKMMPRLSEAERSGQRAVSAAASAAAVSPGMVAPLPKRFSKSAAGPSTAEGQWHPLSDPREAASIRAPLLFSCAACGSNPADREADKLKTKPDDPEFKKLNRKQRKKKMHKSRNALARKTRNLCLYYMQCGNAICRVCIENTSTVRCKCEMCVRSALGSAHGAAAPADPVEVYCSCLRMSTAYAMVMFKATSALPLLGRPPCPRGPNCSTNRNFSCINLHTFGTQFDVAEARPSGVELGKVSEDISVVVRGRLFLNPDRSRDFTWMEHCPTTIGGLRVTDLVLNSPPFDGTFWKLLFYYQDYVSQHDDYIVYAAESVSSCLVRARVCLGSTWPPIVEDVFDALEKQQSEMKPMHILWLYALGLVC